MKRATLSGSKGDKYHTPDEVEIDPATPLMRAAMVKQRNLPWNYAANPDVPFEFTAPPVSDAELLAAAAAAVDDQADRDLARRSPAMAIAKHLLQDSADAAAGFETLADALLAADKHPQRYVFGFDKRHGRAAKRYHEFCLWLRSADHFVLDDDFIARAAQLSWLPPRRLLDMALIARSPGERVWIEWDEQARLAALGIDRAGMAKRGQPSDQQFYVCGLAITLTENGTHVIEIAGLGLDGIVMEVMGFAVEPSGTVPPSLKRDVDRRLAALIATREREALVNPGAPRGDKTGGHVHAFGGHWCDTYRSEAQEIAALLMRFEYVLSRALGWLPLDAAAWVTRCERDGGFLNTTLADCEADLRLALAILALMQSSYTVADRIERQPHATGKAPLRRDFLSFSKVRLKLPKDRPLKVLVADLSKSVRAHKRRHLCLSHWRERAKTKLGCVHTFAALTPQRLRCTKCGHLKWHVRQHERGDATLGYVRHPDYVVTASRTGQGERS
jgi:hypothetical protein